MFLRSVSEEEIKKERKELLHISLFTGVGGFDIGFSRAGIKSAVMVEWSKECIQTLKANWLWSELKNRKDHKGKLIWKNKSQMKKVIKWYHEPEPAILQADITKLSTEDILKAGNLQVGQAFIISGGPPCQGFSMAGKRIIEDPRNKLFKEFVRVVREALPVWFIMENVPGLVSMANGEIIKQICEEFANCGYNVKWEILNAADYGVPQHRRRVFLVGKRIDIMRFPEQGNPQLHMGGMPGEVDHPKKFREKHGLVERSQKSLGDFEEPKTLMDLFKQMNKGVNV